MKKKGIREIKIKRLKIVNYKGIDELEIKFPRPLMTDDPDVVVMGSRNGLGKTSVLECCAMLLIGLSSRKNELVFDKRGYFPIDMPGMIIRAGADKAQVEGEIAVGKRTISVEISIQRSGIISINKKPKWPRKDQQPFYQDDRDVVERFTSIVGGMDPNPLQSEHFLYFHSYRKVQEGNPELGMMVESEDLRHRVRYRPRNNPVMSTFKLQILRSLMSRADLFEKLDDEESGDILNKLNDFIERYAGGRIGKLQASADNTVDFRIQPVDGGSSFTFDGLSSGQKEIIATLFLIWHQTKDMPSVVLIDEPELHLNPEWHRDFIRQLHKLAPMNQYIIATHSEDIFSSVEKEHRILLHDPTGEKL